MEDRFTLKITGRHTHTEGHVRACAAKSGWEVALLERKVIRQNKGKDVLGLIAIFHLASP